eukprot:g20082.t1
MTLRATLKFKPEAGAPDINTDLPLPTGGGGLYTSVVVDSTGAISEDNLVAVTLALGNGFLDKENYVNQEVDKNRVCINRIVYEAGVVYEGGPTGGTWLVTPWTNRPTLSTGAPNPFFRTHFIEDQNHVGQPALETLNTFNTAPHPYFDSMKVPPQQKTDSSVQKKPQAPTTAAWCTVPKCEDFTATAECRDCGGSWSQYGTCDGAHQTRRFTVTQQPTNGGKPCPNPLQQSRACSTTTTSLRVEAIFWALFFWRDGGLGVPLVAMASYDVFSPGGLCCAAV